MSWRTEVSRSGVPRWPRKYLLTTTLVASWLQKSGTSTSFCSKTRLAGLVGDAGGPVLPGDLVVGMDVRAGPAALEGQAADRGCRPVRAVEAGAVRAGVAMRGLGGGSGRPSPVRGLAVVHDRTALPCPRAICSLLRRVDAARRSCRIDPCRRCCRGSWGPLRTGGWGRRGACWASRFDQATLKLIRR